MISVVSNIDWLAVVSAVAVYFVLGGVWYPLVVKRAYARALGKEMKSGLWSLIVPLLCIAVTTIASAMLLQLLSINDYGSAAGLGLLMGLGFLTPTILNIAWNPLFERPFLYTLINAPYFVLGNVIVDMILVAWRHSTRG